MFICLTRTFLELFSSSKSFMERHSGANNGHVVVVGLVDDLSGKEQGCVTLISANCEMLVK